MKKLPPVKIMEALILRIEDEDIDKGQGRCGNCDSLNVDSLMDGAIKIRGLIFYNYTCPDCGFKGREVWANRLVERQDEKWKPLEERQP